jgi:hypothetical protein
MKIPALNSIFLRQQLGSLKSLLNMLVFIIQDRSIRGPFHIILQPTLVHNPSYLRLVGMPREFIPELRGDVRKGVHRHL